MVCIDRRNVPVDIFPDIQDVVYLRCTCDVNFAILFLGNSIFVIFIIFFDRELVRLLIHQGVQDIPLEILDQQRRRSKACVKIP